MATADVQSGRIPDVIHSGRRSHRDSQTTRRASVKASEDSQNSSPRIAIEQHRRSRGERIRSYTNRRQNGLSRRASESALLPPIRVSSIRQPSTSSPTHDANVTSSPTSTSSSPLNAMTSQLQPPPDAERDGPSPLTRRDTASKLSNGESTDTQRLSPLAASDSVRLKAERRVLKSVNDVIDEVSKTPTNQVAEEVPAPTPTPTPKQGVTSKPHLSRRVSMQSLPKLANGEEPFSIRRKIEQFRKWHEEQYMEKLKKLRLEAERDREKQGKQPELSNSSALAAKSSSVELIDFAKILEENMNHSSESSDKKPNREKTDTNGNVAARPSDTFSFGNYHRKSRSRRCKSGGTWRTWRDANDSYAYNDVSKYIEENELLPPDRVDWIHSWLTEVEKALGLVEATDHNGNTEETTEKDQGCVNVEVLM